MNSQTNEAVRVLEAEDTISPLHEEPENIEGRGDESWKKYNLLSLGSTTNFGMILIVLIALFGRRWRYPRLLEPFGSSETYGMHC